MKLDFRVIGSSELKKKLAKVEQLTGRGIEDAIKEMGSSTAKALAIYVQPYGLKTNDKFLRSIKAQVDRAWFGVNVGAYPATTDMRQAHYQARINGVVPKRLFRKERGKPWLGLISGEEKESHAKRQIAKAGRAKGAWVESGNALGRKSFGKRRRAMKISGVAMWIQRHVTSGYGVATIKGSGLGAKIELHNRTPYISNIQKYAEIRKSLRIGRARGLSRLNTIIKAELKKIK